MTPRALIHAAVAAAGLLVAAEARAQGSLVLYCAVQEEWCRAMTTAFERETGIKVVDDPQELGRDLCPGQGRGRQSRAPTSGGAAPAIRTCRPPRKA